MYCDLGNHQKQKKKKKKKTKPFFTQETEKTSPGLSVAPTPAGRVLRKRLLVFPLPMKNALSGLGSSCLCGRVGEGRSNLLV